MKSFPQKANVVIIGAGIVGNSLVYHLAEKGWKDIILLDKGPLPNPVVPPVMRQISYTRSITRRK